MGWLDKFKNWIDEKLPKDNAARFVKDQTYVRAKLVQMGLARQWEFWKSRYPVLASSVEIMVGSNDGESDASEYTPWTAPLDDAPEAEVGESSDSLLCDEADFAEDLAGRFEAPSDEEFEAVAKAHRSRAVESDTGATNDILRRRIN
jgi:hypothetical protein